MAMYQHYYGLKEAPFSLTPDTEFFFGYEAHQEALNVLLVALRSGEGFIKVTGEVGTGKTLVCRKLMSLLDEEFVVAYIPNPQLNPNALRAALADELGIEFARNIGQHRLLKIITERLIELSSEKKRVVVLIDEAQAMPEETLEALRLLTNLETEKFKLMQVVMFGQPELDKKLSEQSVRQLKQRITFAYQLKPLDKNNIGSYIQHRLVIAGYEGTELFNARAVKEMTRASRGIPRLINILSHKAMLAAFGQGAKQIDKEHIRMAVKDSEQARIKRSFFGWRFTLALSLFIVLTGGLVLVGGSLV
jgi:MSHA biogenesis protein MshM